MASKTAPPFAPQNIDLPATLQNLQEMLDTLTATLSPEDTAQIKKIGAKSAGPVLKILVSVLGVVFCAGVYYQQFIQNSATKVDIEAEMKPVKADVDALKTDMNTVKTGVQQLVAAENKSSQIKKLRRRLDRYEKDYQQAIHDWATSGRATVASKPRKSREQLDLENDLEELEKD